jgi:CRP/FNR family transcriptional regulator, cyclic AMP receptor protein
VTTEELLARVPIFAGLTRDQITKLARLVASRSFPRAAVIMREGDGDAALYIIVHGLVSVTKRTPNGDSVELARLSAPDFVGDMALLDGMARSATVTALDDTECMVMSRQFFFATLRNDPEIAVAMLPTLSLRIRLLEKRLMQFSANEVNRHSLA